MMINIRAVVLNPGCPSKLPGDRRWCLDLTLGHPGIFVLEKLPGWF